MVRAAHRSALPLSVIARYGVAGIECGYPEKGVSTQISNNPLLVNSSLLVARQYIIKKKDDA